ncbi:pacman protein, putative [Ixodes scapularis]|uniref:Pacman protein, putative n=1 Tax=Ixodes scapularis TaxID=6945 RepID=B7PTZ6_IXOSC|nr:pacman protein, putative [Ixodes scapularis]|eukprot:XP_002405190.1 pacman protein, putative [Ixodes scapularis]
MIKPRKTFFMAVDGVAPRAKMNQQRGRRFRSAKEALALEKQALSRGEVLPTEARFDSNCISPGTSFMANLQEQLEQFVAMKISSDPLWQEVKVYLSGHQTPGEGEHKIMDFIRTERSKPGYDPNTRHCLYGLDADLIMLGTCSHEPHFALLREEIVYGKKQNQKRLNVPEEITFHLLHLSLLREYLSYEFQAVKDSLPFEFSLESLVDDWVLMCFLVGNDFLPHLPNLHIAHNALPILYQAYIEVLPTLGGYINEQGTLNLERFEKFLKRLSQFDYEKFTDVQADQKFLESKRTAATAPNGVVSQDSQDKAARDKERDPDEQRKVLLSPGLLEKFSHLDIPDYESDEESEGTLEMEFRQHKRDYYTTKLEYKDVNKEVMQEQAHGYVRAIQWNLHYYYNGVQSWNWYYPHHYSPYISDIKDFQSIDMSFELGKPFLPFQQLMSILPAASKGLVPKAYQALMEGEESPVLDYYPQDFTTDLNGKQQEWEAVVLIPFIDEDRLLPVMQELDSKLTDEERERNTHGGHLLFTYSHEPVTSLKCKNKGLLPNIEVNHARVEVLDKNIFRLPKEEIKKGLLDGVKTDIYFAGFPTFRHLPHTAKLERASVKVFQSLSKNESVLLTLTETPDKTLKEVADELLGKSVYVNWPHLLEALVVAVTSRDERYICGPKGRITLDKQWSLHSVPYALQSLVKDITEHCPEFEQFKTVEELFPVGKTCFMLGHPHYGCQGEVVDPKPSTKQGRIVVRLNIPPEPNLEGVNLSQVHYMSSHQLAQWLGVNGLFVSRITGTVYVQMNSREADAPSLVNVGLNLKFNKSGEEVPGYSKRANETWFYSNKCHNVLQEYLTKFASFVEKIQPFMDRDRISVEDLYYKGEGKEEVREVAKWIKEQECAQLPRVKSGSESLDEGVVKAIEDTVDKLRAGEQQRSTFLDVQPKSLFRAALHCGWMQPDPSATFRLFDRVVNVRENIAVPLGLRGTVTGICKVEEGEPKLCEVVFDQSFVGGLTLRCSPNRGYKLSTLSLVNLSHGVRTQRGQQLYQVPARRQEQHAQSSPAPEPPIDSSSGSTDFASLWLGLQKASSLPQTANTQPAPLLPTYESSLHQGTPVSIEELFKGG